MLLDGVSYLAAPGSCIIGLVAGQDDSVLGEEVKEPDREPMRDKGRLAMARRHADDQPGIAPGHSLSEQKGQLTKVAVEPPLAARKPLRKRPRCGSPGVLQEKPRVERLRGRQG